MKYYLSYLMGAEKIENRDLADLGIGVEEKMADGDRTLKIPEERLRHYQETKREKWTCGNVEITIDTWPWVPTFVELEGFNEEDVKMAASLLGLDWSKAMHGSVETIYQMHYDFTEAEIDHWETITFIPEPDWLLAKKK